ERVLAERHVDHALHPDEHLAEVRRDLVRVQDDALAGGVRERERSDRVRGRAARRDRAVLRPRADGHAVKTNAALRVDLGHALLARVALRDRAVKDPELEWRARDRAL